jgi:predicted dienelactone hydrolase
MPSIASSQKATETAAYDPFVRGRFPVGVRTFQALDAARDRVFPCEIWYPAAAQHAGQDLAAETQDAFTIPAAPPWRPRDTTRSQTAVRDAAAHAGTFPLILFSHHSGGHRRAATFLQTHLSSHGYIVAALDHSEIVAKELGHRDGETFEQLSTRVDAWIANRVPDIRFLLDHLLGNGGRDSEARPDPERIGLAGHSFGGWTALAAPDVEARIRAVVALAPAGNSNPKPGVIPAKLTFNWGRDVPTLLLAAENDIPLPLPGMYEIFERTPGTKQMVILRRADHGHFLDNIEEEHESARKMLLGRPELAWMGEAMQPIAELSSGDQAHLWARGLTLCHMDAHLRNKEDAQRFLAGDIAAELAARGVDVMVHKSA